MFLYRFGNDASRSAVEEFNGMGGFLGAGRWHIQGTPVVYTATSEELALLEKLVHMPPHSKAVSFPLYIAELSESLVQQLRTDSLPSDWRSLSPPRSTQALGDRWLRRLDGVALLVPSVLTTGFSGRAKNCLLNPKHPDFSSAKLTGPLLVPIDPRLIKFRDW